MPKKKSNGGRAVATAKNTNLARLPERIAIGDHEVRPEQLYIIKKRQPRGSGPWTDEKFDKVAWNDAETGLDCILLRQASGVWGGFVAVPPSHPLYGYREDAVPAAIGLTPHRGIDYAEACSRYEDEAVRVCHVHSRRNGPQAEDQTGDNAWWFGFAADRPGDLVPSDSKPILAREEGEIYRGIDYMYSETVQLARQLKAIDDSSVGKADPVLAPPPPRLGKPGGR
ncbi:hypothetical protein QQS45_09030 [Alteriqipengyuania flavescens]|uniref:hypothetical protein n=1 Tax=Alteriqipengyuania flavescens TaxID=3053610 RepID=UPI0025B56B12|nr:hypothetical protein [Alteriqipengyuania flavescens]WJY17782.1 hypothetical protein QQW98_09025 [Alteriqipengyuania flavescens]WJY23724.1 hypothetical protein QQS45_09030 [Alteriqipengyuania flavescens]